MPPAITVPEVTLAPTAAPRVSTIVKVTLPPLTKMSAVPEVTLAVVVTEAVSSTFCAVELYVAVAGGNTVPPALLAGSVTVVGMGLTVRDALAVAAW